MDTVNERSSWISTIAFTDENGLAISPSSASYRIDDVGSGAEIRDNTAITPLASSVEIVWTPEDTKILSDVHLFEVRVLTVTWLYGTSKQGTEEYILKIKNLKGLLVP